MYSRTRKDKDGRRDKGKPPKGIIIGDHSSGSKCRDETADRGDRKSQIERQRREK